jgi:3'-5' exoribonuclease
MTGVILHDIGKIHELTYDRSFGYSTEGQLLGHIIIALRMVDEKVRQVPGFPAKLRTLVEHMIVSHHGELEFGSPKVPLFPEALLLHHLDNLDSKMEAMRAFLHKDRQVEGCWTGYNQALERSVLKKKKYLDDQPEPEPSPALEDEAPKAVEPEIPKSQPFTPQTVPQPPAQFKPQSLFGEKLKGALHKDS